MDENMELTEEELNEKASIEEGKDSKAIALPEISLKREEQEDPIKMKDVILKERKFLDKAGKIISIFEIYRGNELISTIDENGVLLSKNGEELGLVELDEKALKELEEMELMAEEDIDKMIEQGELPEIEIEEIEKEEQEQEPEKEEIEKDDEAKLPEGYKLCAVIKGKDAKEFSETVPGTRNTSKIYVGLKDGEFVFFDDSGNQIPNVSDKNQTINGRPDARRIKGNPNEVLYVNQDPYGKVHVYKDDLTDNIEEPAEFKTNNVNPPEEKIVDTKEKADKLIKEYGLTEERAILVVTNKETLDKAIEEQENEERTPWGDAEARRRR